MVAAHSLAQDLVLVTNDRAFGQVSNLKLEDWTLPYQRGGETRH